ncbi:MAG: hypothetical protein J6R04_04060, partial [Clostridia bacterium]|nr:hypothetical protein [Clostridia bacterium]
MRIIWKRVLSLIFALTMLISSCLTGLLAVSAAESEEFAEKWVIHDGGANGTQVKRNANSHMEWSKSGFALQLPKTLTLDKLGLYIRITLDQAAADVMNKGGSIELAQKTCDQAEISIGIQTVEWRVGLNEVIIPIGADGGYTDGTQGHFDMYKPINWFRFYTTPGSANLSQNSSITIWEIAVVDSTAIGMEFGTSDAYLQLGAPITGTPNTIEASVKTDAVLSEWSVGLTGAARYNADIMSGTSGTATAADAQSYGIPEGTRWVGATVHAGGYYGTKDQKFSSVAIPRRYGINDLALSFWLYVSDPAMVSKMASYIELTSSGKCDSEELEWATYGTVFSNLKTGWNRIVLPFANASRNGGTINLANLNFLRIWGNSGAQHVATTDVDIRFSEMTVITVGGASDEEVSGLEIVDGLPTWKLLDFTKAPHNWDKGVMSVGHVWENDGTDALQPADGTTYMEVRPGATLVFESNQANPGKEYWKGGFGA